jgi:cysteine desulfurase
MQPFLALHYGNPSGGHRASQATKTAVEAAREEVAAILGARPNEIVFTGGGSEADNLAVKGVAWAGLERGLDGVVTSAIEHKAVLGAVRRLERQGHRVFEVGATPDGVVDLELLASSLDDATAIVSVMVVNNETGVVQPLDDVAELVRERAPNARLHTDAVQAPQWLDLRTVASRANLISVSGHKFGGPKGVGALVVRGGTELVPLVEGGGHEWSLRAGTHNVAGIVAFAAALRATDSNRDTESARIARLRDELESRLRSRLPDLVVNGDASRRVAGVLHVSFPGIEAETLLMALDQSGVYAASGSACSSGAIDPSHVLLAMGMPRARALAAVRFSLGYASTEADVIASAPVIVRCVEQLRAAAA